MAIESHLTEILPAHEFDVDRLKKYLSSRLAGFSKSVRIRQFIGGQSNPTFLIETDNGKYVLRKKPPGRLLKSAHMVEREYRVITALHTTSVPVPKTYLLCEDEEIIGTPFFLMEFLDGRLLGDPAIPGCDNETRARVYRSMIKALADLHKVDWKSIGLSDFGKQSDYLIRQINVWTRQYDAAQDLRIKTMGWLQSWLIDNLPPENVTTIVHGDYRLDNLILYPEKPDILGILDWELSTLGDPLCDLAHNTLAYYLPRKFGPLSGLQGVDIAAKGIPKLDQYVAQYCDYTNVSELKNFNFYLALSCYRLASISAGVYSRGLQGIASSPNAVDVGSTAEGFANLGRQLAEETFTFSLA